MKMLKLLISCALVLAAGAAQASTVTSAYVHGSIYNGDAYGSIIAYIVDSGNVNTVSVSGTTMGNWADFDQNLGLTEMEVDASSYSNGGTVSFTGEFGLYISSGSTVTVGFSISTGNGGSAYVTVDGQAYVSSSSVALASGSHTVCVYTSSPGYEWSSATVYLGVY